MSKALEELNRLKRSALSKAEETLALQIRINKMEQPVREYRFDDVRRWRFDFAWPDLFFAVEVEGITYEHGRHQRKEGFEADLEKYQSAMLQGWTVYRASGAMVESGSAYLTIETMLKLINENTGLMDELADHTDAPWMKPNG